MNLLNKIKLSRLTEDERKIYNLLFKIKFIFQKLIIDCLYDGALYINKRVYYTILNENKINIFLDKLINIMSNFFNIKILGYGTINEYFFDENDLCEII